MKLQLNLVFSWYIHHEVFSFMIVLDDFFKFHFSCFTLEDYQEFYGRRFESITGQLFPRYERCTVSGCR